MVNTKKISIAGKFIGLMMVVVVAFNIAWPVIDSVLYGGDSYASGTLTYIALSNVSDGELVNISSYTFEYDFNGAYTTGHIQVPMSTGHGNATYAILNLITAIQNNASVSGLVSVAES